MAERCSPDLAAGGLWLALWRQRWRWLGLLPCIAAIGLVLLSRPPDLLVDRTLGMAAVRHADGTVTMLEWHRDRLVQETWLRNLGTAAPLAAPKPGAGTDHDVTCDEAGCVVALGGLRVTLAQGWRQRSRTAAGSTWSWPGPGRSAAGMAATC